MPLLIADQADSTVSTKQSACLQHQPRKPRENVLLISTFSPCLCRYWSEKVQAVMCCLDSDVASAHSSDKLAYGTLTADKKHGDQVSNSDNV